MVTAQNLHQLVLKLVDILELVDHDVLQPLLPLEPNVRMLLENIQGELDQVVIIQSETLLLLIQIAVENDVCRGVRLVILLLQRVQRHGDHIQIVVRTLEQLLHLDHVPGCGEGHIPQRQSPLLVDDLEHSVDVRVVQHQKAFGILDGVAVLLEHGDAETVEGVDIARVIVAGEDVDALAHLICGFVGEGDAEDISRCPARSPERQNDGRAPLSCRSRLRQ